MILYDRCCGAISSALPWTALFLLCSTTKPLPAMISSFDQVLSASVAIILSNGMESCHAA